MGQENCARTYLLDTSAFRALSVAQLTAAASRDARLVVSPFCFWELLTHLEDDGEFARVRGNLMKFRHVQAVDDPRASIEREIVGPDDSVHERVEDSDLIYGTLAALRASASIADFYGKQIRDGKSQVREIEGAFAEFEKSCSERNNAFRITSIRSLLQFVVAMFHWRPRPTFTKERLT